MHSKFITFKQLMHDYHNVLDSEIQRKYEWDKEKVKEFCVKITNSANEYYENPKQSDCKRDLGGLDRFEIPKNDRGYCPNKESFYVDEGGQRIVTSSIVTKSIYDIIVENNNLYDWVPIVSEITNAYINGLIKDIENHFVTEGDAYTFECIMHNIQDVKNKDFNKAINDAYLISREYFSELLYSNIEAFKNVSTFIVDDFGYVVHDYNPTPRHIRLEKYNEINSLVQPQSDLHRMLSKMSELAEKKGCRTFTTRHNEAMNKSILGKKITTSVMEQYYFIKTGWMVLSKGYFILNRDNALGAVNQFCVHEMGDYNYFDTFFDDFNLYCSLKNRCIRWMADDSKDNRVLGFLSTTLIEPFIYNKTSRNATSAYMFHFIKNFFSIIYNCQINGLKNERKKNKVIKLLSYIFVFRICLMARCDGNVAADERGVFGSLLKDMDCIATDENVLDKHIEVFKKKAYECITSTSYQYIGSTGLTYTSKGTRFVASIISMDGETMSEWLKDGTAKFLNFNDYDLDHILWKCKYEKESWVNSLWNLRLMFKANNRADNTPNENGRFIGRDSSIPAEMHNGYFTADSINDRGAWITKKLHKVINYVLENIKDDVAEIQTNSVACCVS